MSFKYSAFTENTPEMREWLEGIGRKRKDMGLSHPRFILALGMHYMEVDNPNVPPIVINCLGNPKLFKAVTAIRDDSDYMQWFKMNDFDKWYRHIPVHKDLKHQSAFKVIREDKWHKATLEELQGYFKIEKK